MYKVRNPPVAWGTDHEACLVVGMCRGKRFPLPNTYRTILEEHLALQDLVGRDALGIMAQVKLWLLTTLSTCIDTPSISKISSAAHASSLFPA